MAPVLQRLVAFALRVMFGLLLLSQVPFVTADDLPHMTKILFIIS